MLRFLIPPLLSAALLSASVCTGLWELAYLALVPVFLTLRTSSPKDSFKTFFVLSFLYNLAVFAWLIKLTFTGYVLLCLLHAAVWGISGAAFSRISRANLYLLPFAWVIMDYIIGRVILHGLPWSILPLSQHDNLTLIQIAEYTGTAGVTWTVVLMNTIAADTIDLLRIKGNPPAKRLTLCIAACTVALWVHAGGAVLLKINAQYLENRQRTIPVTLVHGGVEPQLRWGRDFADASGKHYIDRTLACPSTGTLFIWPESAAPDALNHIPLLTRIGAAAAAKQSFIIFGSTMEDFEKSEGFNCAALMDTTGKVASIYKKIHLVPFGEYVPLGGILPRWLSVLFLSFDAGTEYTVFDLPLFTTGCATLICFEDIFPDIACHFVQKGARFLVTITNDGWYYPQGGIQHAWLSLFRAVENRRWLVRSTNMGLTCFIDPCGRIVSSIDSASKTPFLQGTIPPETRLTFYTLHGDLFTWLCLLILIIWLLAVFVRRKASSQSSSRH